MVRKPKAGEECAEMHNTTPRLACVNTFVSKRVKLTRGAQPVLHPLGPPSRPSPAQCARAEAFKPTRFQAGWNMAEYISSCRLGRFAASSTQLRFRSCDDGLPAGRCYRDVYALFPRQVRGIFWHIRFGVKVKSDLVNLPMAMLLGKPSSLRAACSGRHKLRCCGKHGVFQ